MSRNKYTDFIDEIIKEVEKELEESTATGAIDGYQTPNAFGNNSEKSKKKTRKTSTQAGYTVIGNNIRNISESKKIKEQAPKKRKNRWLELKNDDSMHAHKKLSVGLKELKYQLREVERFLGWYNKIKNINELDSDEYWKRTNTNIRNIKERIINIVRTLQEIER